MSDEHDTSDIESETDNVQPSDDDTPQDYTYWDPDEDEPDTPESEIAEGTDDEEGEAEEEPDEESEEEPAREAEESAVVKLADGSQVTVGELIKGHLRQSDYTRKSQEVASARKAVEAEASQLSKITQAFVDHLSGMIPAEPDHAMALRDPAAYTRAKAQYDAAISQVQKLIELGSQPKEVTDRMTQEQRRQVVQQENARLVEMFPEAGTQDGRRKFFEGVQEVANTLGFTDEELQQSTDHRLFALAHWAKQGMAAQKAKEAAKAKAKKAPPVTPQKPGDAGRKASKNSDAMRKLIRTGSFKDALAVDWE